MIRNELEEQIKNEAVAPCIAGEMPDMVNSPAHYKLDGVVMHLNISLGGKRKTVLRT